MDEEKDVASVDSMPSEKVETFSQDDLQRIVKREKAEVAERVRRELEAAHRDELEKIRLGQTQQLGGVKDTNNVDVEKIKQDVLSQFEAQMAAKEQDLAKQQHDAEMRRIADSYFSKIKAGKDRYSDFDEIVGDFEHKAFPQLVWAVSGMDNAADILYELNKNPDKLERIDYWLNKQPQRGIDMLNKLSQSIAQVRQASDEYQPTPPPLDQIRPSNVGMDSRNPTLEDLKRDPNLMF